MEEKKDINIGKTGIKSNSTKKLDCPVKVYFNREDYEILNDIANKNGLDTAAFIRSKMKVMIEEEKINKLMFSTITISRDNKTNEEKFDSIIIALGFATTQIKRAKDDNEKNLLLNIIKNFFDQIIIMTKDNKKEEVKEKLYHGLDYYLQIDDVIELDKLKKFIKK